MYSGAESTNDIRSTFDNIYQHAMNMHRHNIAINYLTVECNKLGHFRCEYTRDTTAS